MTATQTSADDGSTAAEAVGWSPPGGAYYEGQWQSGPRRLVVRDPEDNRVVGEVVEATAADVDRAVRHLARTFQAIRWPLWQRRAAMVRAADLLGERAAQFIRLISTEGCKTVTEATAEVERAREVLGLCGQLSTALMGRSLPFEDTPRGTGWRGWYRRKPVGVVAAITPFNDPLNLVVHKLGPALVAGNTVGLKPAPTTPLTALAFVEVLLNSGVPPDALAVLCGVEAGPALVRHPLVDAVSFTGGTATADRIASSGPARKLLMELGGNNAVIVCADADPVEVAESVVAGAFGVAGQNCLSVQRVLVHRSIYHSILSAITRRTESLVVGSKHSPETDVGPMITVGEAERVAGEVRRAVAVGATLVTGGGRRGPFVTPTVLTDVPRNDPIWTDEIFGPVVVVSPFDALEEAVAAVNEVDTGLQAGVFTADIDVAMELADLLRVGAVMINSTSDFRIDAMPFGGFKRSGIGREGVESSILALSEPKIVAIKTRQSF